MLSWAKVSNTTDYNFKNEGIRPSIGFGPSFKKYLGDNSNVDASLLFSWQKSTFSATPASSTSSMLPYQMDLTLQYVQIPVVFEGAFDIMDGLKGLIDFGASPAIKISGKTDVYTDARAQLLEAAYNAPVSFFNLYLKGGQVFLTTLLMS